MMGDLVYWVKFKRCHFVTPVTNYIILIIRRYKSCKYSQGFK